MTALTHLFPDGTDSLTLNNKQRSSNSFVNYYLTSAFGSKILFVTSVCAAGMHTETRLIEAMTLRGSGMCNERPAKTTSNGHTSAF